MLDREKFEQELNVILENVDIDAFAEALTSLDEFDNAQEHLTSSQNQYNGHINSLNALLAGLIRNSQPGLTVKLGRDGSIIISYHRSGSKQMRLSPDVRNKRWNVGDSSFEQHYNKYCGDSLSVDLPSMGKSIADYFTRSFRSLREGTEPNEGKLITEEIIDTNTVAGAGVVNRLRAAYGELRVAYEFAKRAEMSKELISDLNSIGSNLIALCGNLAASETETEEDINYDAEDIGSPA